MPPSVVPSIATRRLHPLSSLSIAAVTAGRLWPLWLVVLANRRLSVIVIPVLAIVVVIGILRWWRTTYGLGGDGLVVASGVLWRQVQTVPPQRVQQVDRRRGLRHRLLGLTEIRIGFAGGGATNEITLDALADVQASELTAVLERWRTGIATGSGEQPPPDAGASVTHGGAPVVLLRVDLGRIVLAGLTSRTLWIAPLAALFGLLQFLSDIGLADESRAVVETGLRRTAPLLSAVVVLVIAMMIGIVTAVVADYGLVVERAGGELRIARGLIEQRAATVPIERVQLVRTSTNIARAALGLAALDIHTADLAAQAGDARRSTSITIGARGDIDRLGRACLLGSVTGEASGDVPGDIELPATSAHPPVAVRREITRRLAVSIPPAVVIGWIFGGIREAAALAVIAVLGAVATGWPAARRMRSGTGHGLVVTERGWVLWRRWAIPIARIQSVGIHQTPLQRRHQLVDLRFDVAGALRGVIMRDLSVVAALEVLDDTRTCRGSTLIPR